MTFSPKFPVVSLFVFLQPGILKLFKKEYKINGAKSYGKTTSQLKTSKNTN
jgi:hypothetical protein